MCITISAVEIQQVSVKTNKIASSVRLGVFRCKFSRVYQNDKERILRYVPTLPQFHGIYLVFIPDYFGICGEIGSLDWEGGKHVSRKFEGRNTFFSLRFWSFWYMREILPIGREVGHGSLVVAPDHSLTNVENFAHMSLRGGGGWHRFVMCCFFAFWYMSQRRYLSYLCIRGRISHRIGKKRGSIAAPENA